MLANCEAVRAGIFTQMKPTSRLLGWWQPAPGLAVTIAGRSFFRGQNQKCVERDAHMKSGDEVYTAKYQASTVRIKKRINPKLKWKWCGNIHGRNAREMGARSLKKLHCKKQEHNNIFSLVFVDDQKRYRIDLCASCATGNKAVSVKMAPARGRAVVAFFTKPLGSSCWIYGR